MPSREMMLTDLEQQAIHQAGQLWNTLCAVVGRGPTRDADLADLAHHVHAIQHTVMSQAAARAYPDTYRLLGDTFAPCCDLKHEHDGAGCIACPCPQTPWTGGH